MPETPDSRIDLKAIARQVMKQYGFEPDFPPEVTLQLTQIQQNLPNIAASADIRDLRTLLWSSIDNDTSRDLDQIEVAERLADGQIKVMIAIADVDAFVPKDSPIDKHAALETTTVYTGVSIFPMLPEQLSTGATSLLEGADKLSVVTEYVVRPDGNLSSSSIYRAVVRNKAQLAYRAVGAWLEGTAEAASKVAASPDLQAQLKLQDLAAQTLRKRRYDNGALDVDTAEVHPVMRNDQVVDIAPQDKNRATDLIEDFMIAANGVVARALEKVSSLRRVVKTPERWDRIVQLANGLGETLPPDPDSKALNDFLIKRRATDPDHFADLSLSVIKLIGPGEYVVERPGQPAQGHFGLAVQDYTHSTAPNRRFADIVTQRLIKTTIDNRPSAYSDAELEAIASNCTAKGDAERKVERQMAKRMAALAMAHRIGESFDAIVTGVTPKGTFVRVMQPHVEGLLTEGASGLDVGDKSKVKLTRTDVQRGYIDFIKV